MAQAGIHALVGVAAGKIVKNKEGVLLGLILGNLLPDTDNLAVAAATLMGGNTEGLHRTFTHSIFTVFLSLGIFYLVGYLTAKDQWKNIGLGIGIGILMHILLDLVIWFDGVQLFWPLPYTLNFWENVQVPLWWSQLMMPVEFFFMAALLYLLYHQASLTHSDMSFLPALKWIVYTLMALFVTFTILVYLMGSGFLVPFGALYLVALGVVIWVVFRMRQTIRLFELQYTRA